MSSPETPERLPLTSPDLAAERLARLRELLPGAIVEGKVVPERLAELVGAAAVSSKPERYGLSYAGRTEALREMLAPSTGTLRPDRAASEAWDATENLIIEGDNLHVLKLLQSAYAGAVKLIYIDPPYNTGNDFVYPDNFRAGLKHYKEQTQQTLSTNPETSGRYHSDWLRMMHPRLALARNLLRDDGVIFVSIDDHEVANLRLLMDEVFGEENFVSELIWKNKYNAGALTKGFSSVHEYILCYSRMPIENVSSSLSEEAIGDYKGRDAKLATRGGFVTQPLATGSKDLRPNLRYPIIWQGQEIWPEKQWLWSKERVEAAIANDEVVFNENDGKVNIRVKQYLRDENGQMRKMKPLSLLIGPFNQEGSKETEFLVGDGVFDFPKPVALIRHLLGLTINDQDSRDVLILDFFGGSGTTGQAVLELNRQDGGNRKFVLVQFPEPTGREDFKTIADITRERVRRVIARRPADLASGKPEGFRAYRLEESNFKVWDGETAPRDAAGLAKQLELMAHNVVDGRTDEDLLAEILLKCGHPGITLSSPVEVREVAGQPVHLLAAGALAVCLGRTLSQEALRGIIALSPQRVLCLDVGFHGNDELKTNTVLEMKSHGIQFQTV